MTTIKTWQDRARESLHPSIGPNLSDDELSIIGTKHMLAYIADLEAELASQAESAPVDSFSTQLHAEYAPRAIFDVAPEPFVLGNQYRTQGGRMVRFVGIANKGSSYETMCDELGHHRYTQRDFGRGTGAPWDDDCVPPLYTYPSIQPAPAAGVPHIERDAALVLRAQRKKLASALGDALDGYHIGGSRNKEFHECVAALVAAVMAAKNKG